jgi:hypothetical protein
MPPAHCAAAARPRGRALVHAAAAWHGDGRTPLLVAAAYGHTDALALLAQLGAALDAQTNSG